MLEEKKIPREESAGKTIFISIFSVRLFVHI